MTAMKVVVDGTWSTQTKTFYRKRFFGPKKKFLILTQKMINFLSEKKFHTHPK